MSFFRRLGRAAAHDGGADGVEDAGGEGPLGPLRRVLAQLVPHPLQRLDRRLRRAPRRVSSEGRSARNSVSRRDRGDRIRPSALLIGVSAALPTLPQFAPMAPLARIAPFFLTKRLCARHADRACRLLHVLFLQHQIHAA